MKAILILLSVCISLVALTSWLSDIHTRGELESVDQETRAAFDRQNTALESIADSIDAVARDVENLERRVSLLEVREPTLADEPVAAAQSVTSPVSTEDAAPSPPDWGAPLEVTDEERQLNTVLGKTPRSIVRLTPDEFVSYVSEHFDVEPDFAREVFREFAQFIQLEAFHERRVQDAAVDQKTRDGDYLEFPLETDSGTVKASVSQHLPYDRVLTRRAGDAKRIFLFRRDETPEVFEGDLRITRAKYRLIRRLLEAAPRKE